VLGVPVFLGDGNAPKLFGVRGLLLLSVSVGSPFVNGGVAALFEVVRGVTNDSEGIVLNFLKELVRRVVNDSEGYGRNFLKELVRDVTSGSEGCVRNLFGEEEHL